MKIRNNITILINEYWLRNITRYEQYYNLTYKFLILNLSLTITFIKLETFFASKSQGGGANGPPPTPLYFSNTEQRIKKIEKIQDAINYFQNGKYTEITKELLLFFFLISSSFVLSCSSFYFLFFFFLIFILLFFLFCSSFFLLFFFYILFFFLFVLLFLILFFFFLILLNF